MSTNINFVPDDYIQSSESQRTNLMYLVLFAVVMAVFGGTFVVIRIRQQALNASEKLVSEKLNRAQEAIDQFEELQRKRKAMMKTALTTAELLEPVPRSVLLASLTNNLPPRVSLLKLKLIQKEPKKAPPGSAASAKAPTNKYTATKAEKDAAETEVSREKLLETHISIEGIAPSDLELASYIERLSSSSLLDSVALVESIEYKSKSGSSAGMEPGPLEKTYRSFKLTAMLRKDIHLTSEDVRQIAFSKGIDG